MLQFIKFVVPPFVVPLSPPPPPPLFSDVHEKMNAKASRILVASVILTVFIIPPYGL
jgi:hypothetical protein